MNKNTKLSKFKAFELAKEQQKEVKGGMKSKDNLQILSFIVPKMSIWGEVEVRRPILGDISPSQYTRSHQNSPKKKIKP